MKTLYPQCRAFGLRLLEVKGVGSVVPDKELVRALTKAQRKQFNEFYGCQTRVEEGAYAWDVEAVLERMNSGRLTGTQLDWD